MAHQQYTLKGTTTAASLCKEDQWSSRRVRQGCSGVENIPPWCNSQLASHFSTPHVACLVFPYHYCSLDTGEVITLALLVTVTYFQLSVSPYAACGVKMGPGSGKIKDYLNNRPNSIFPHCINDVKFSLKKIPLLHFSMENYPPHIGKYSICLSIVVRAVVLISTCFCNSIIVGWLNLGYEVWPSLELVRVAGLYKQHQTSANII